MWLTRLALRYPISTFLFAMTILVFGIVSFTQLPVDLLPNINVPVVSVITFYTGAGPLDMEQSVTRIIERGVSSTNNVDYVASSTREGISSIRIYFTWDANVDVGLVDVVQHVNRILTQLPTGISTPVALRFDITSVPVCNIAVSADMDERDLYDLAYNTIEPQIEHPLELHRRRCSEGGYARFTSRSTGTGSRRWSFPSPACSTRSRARISYSLPGT